MKQVAPKRTEGSERRDVERGSERRDVERERSGLTAARTIKPERKVARSKYIVTAAIGTDQWHAQIPSHTHRPQPTPNHPHICGRHIGRPATARRYLGTSCASQASSRTVHRPLPYSCELTMLAMLQSCPLLLARTLTFKSGVARSICSLDRILIVAPPDLKSSGAIGRNNCEPALWRF